MDAHMGSRVTRRSINRLVLAGVTIPLAGSLLAACGSDEGDNTTNTTTSGGAGTAQTTETTSGTPTGGTPTDGTVTSQSTAPTGKSAVDKIVVVVGQDVSTLDPHNEPSTNFSQLGQAFENLTRIDDQLAVQPALAEKWELIDDTTWEFKLRGGVKFHNGDVLTMDDITWNFNRVMTEANPSGPRKEFVSWFDSLEVVDDSTFRIHTKGPYPAVTVACTGAMIIPKKYFEKVGPDGFNRNPVGTGPYKISSWSVNQNMQFAVFDDYWGQRGVIPAAEFRVIPEESTRINEIITGNVDVVLNLSPNRVVDLQGKDNVKVVSKESVLSFWLGFNTNTKPFDDVNVRKAVALSINVPLIIKEVLGGLASQSNSMVQTSVIGWNKDLPPFEYDPDQAKQLLSSAGHANGFKATFMGGPTVWPSTKESGEAISGFFSDVGIDAPFQLIEWGDYFARFRNGKLEGLFLWGHFADRDPQNHLDLDLHSPPIGQQSYYNSSDLDALIDSARVDMNPDSRISTIKKIQKLLQDEVGMVPLWQYKEVEAISTRIDWQPRGDYGFELNEVKPASTGGG